MFHTMWKDELASGDLSKVKLAGRSNWTDGVFHSARDTVVN